MHFRDEDFFSKAREGKLEFDKPIATLTWFQVGGNAKIFFCPDNIQALSEFISEKPKDLPVFVIGAGSNIIVRDGGFDGIIIKLSKNFSKINFVDEDKIEVGASCLVKTLAMHCLEKSIGGLEFLFTIPATVGGAVFMNAGSYGSEIKDILEWVEVIDDKGNILKINSDDLNMTYRSSGMNKNFIIVKACFKGLKEEKSKIFDRMDQFSKARMASQPTRGRTGGSTFKNPSNDKKAWELIDESGCRSWSEGKAIVSEKHCNFLINTSDCKAFELENLGERIRKAVKQKTGINLEWEIKIIGKQI
jgi:UDP-N-acetylmuramate dehydrogenase